MKKNIAIAGMLALVVIVIGFGSQMFIQNKSQSPQTLSDRGEQPESAAAAVPESGGAFSLPPGIEVSPLRSAAKTGESEEEIVIQTNQLRAVFSTKGGVLVSLQLVSYTDHRGVPLELIEASGQEALYPFSTTLGGDFAEGVGVLYHAADGAPPDGPASEGQDSVAFSRDFLVENEGARTVYRLTKRFEMKDDEFLIRCRIELEKLLAAEAGGPGPGEQGRSELSADPFYTIGLGAGVGPVFRYPQKRRDYQRLVFFDDGRKQAVPLESKRLRLLEEAPAWAGYEGSYTAVVLAGIPRDSLVGFEKKGRLSGDDPGRLVVAPAGVPGKRTDEFFLYAGPTDPYALGRYTGRIENAFGWYESSLAHLLPEENIMTRLSGVIKTLVDFFYRYTGNYGVAIILMAVFIKIVLLPLSHRGFAAVRKTQLLAPRIRELHREFGSNRRELDIRLNELYRDYRIKPSASFLPVLIQLPVLLGLYSILSGDLTYYGGGFIPGFIPDISLPDILGPLAKIDPGLGEAIRFLPIITLVVMMYQSRYVQPPVGGGKAAFLLSYLFPVVVFLILYNLPAGLVLYWLVQTIFSILHQSYVNKTVT
ncbi:MAG: membrane protein insertase YidC [Spirochaetales bacterium]|nr:membrane protein insertase YidC [Spirochaetales bacterium]MCF7938302.1 membrane protein insertase YidC [Spirochaetales bacterium]